MVQSIEDYWNISNQINSRRNQTSILYIKFSVFFRWKAVHENACKGLTESTENCWNSFQGVNLERQSPLGIFLRDKTVFDFFDREAWLHVCNTRTCTQKLSYFHVFTEECHLSPSAQGKNMFSGKKYHLSREYKKDHVTARPF